MIPTTNRDQAVKIVVWFLRTLFVWTHKPWTPTEQTIAERLVDTLIAAAVDQLRATDDGAVLLDELRPAHPASAQTRQFRRDDDALYAEDTPSYQAYLRRRQAEDQASVGRSLRQDGRSRKMTI